MATVTLAECLAVHADAEANVYGEELSGRVTPPLFTENDIRKHQGPDPGITHVSQLVKTGAEPLTTLTLTFNAERVETP